MDRSCQLYAAIFGLLPQLLPGSCHGGTCWISTGRTHAVLNSSSGPRRSLRATRDGGWASELDGLLAANAAKPAREQLTLIRIFEELRGRGYDGGYDAVRRYARR